VLSSTEYIFIQMIFLLKILSRKLSLQRERGEFYDDVRNDVFAISVFIIG